MASNINPYNVDGTFPIAGQDNPSQGFRDNFTNIKNNLLYAQSELTDLQGKAILTGALSGQTLNNDMAGTVITRPQLRAWTQSLLDLGAASNAIQLDFNSGNFQKITTAASITIGLQNWPSSIGTGAIGYGILRTLISVSDIAHTVTLPSTVTIGVDDIAGASFDGTQYTITFDSTGDYIFDFSSADGGNNYLIFDVTRNSATFRDPDFYYNSEVNSTVLIGYGVARPLALTLERGNNMISTLGSYNSVTIGNLQLANVAYAQTDTGTLGGFAVSAARGNVNTISTLTSNCAVKSNDPLGAFNAYAFTGNGVSNVFQLSSSISMFATGSNVQYGLGGNIAIFVAANGRPVGTAANYNTVQQAIGIENDTSVKLYGNVEVTGALKRSGGVIENGTYVTNVNTSGVNTITANANVSTMIITSTGDATVAQITMQLPTAPVRGQRIKIVSLPVITAANVWNAEGYFIRAGGTVASSTLLSPSKFTGNTGITLTYMPSLGWLLS